ncbi:MAG: mechanosensitive ion channel [Spirochaetaceae bacterium]|jgi:small conductance mechanosensitive channel|nr:mechanosensitive ion channel [Spirochaetaceae bacterium]
MAINFLPLWENHSGIILGLVRNIVVSLIIVAAGTITTRITGKLLKKATAGGLLIDETVTRILRRTVRYGIFVICVIMILNTFGINTTSLLAVLGAAGVAVGLALKDTLGNIAAGIILLILGSYRRGEYIEFDAYSGTVKDMNLFTTTLETPDGLFISAPNSSIWGTPLKNYSRYGKRRMELSVGISYSDSIDTAFRVMRDIAGAETRFLKDPAPQVLLQSLGDSSVNIALRAWASTDVYWDIYWDQIKNLKLKIEEAGLHIPFPQRDMHIIADQGKGIKTPGNNAPDAPA